MLICSHLWLWFLSLFFLFPPPPPSRQTSVLLFVADPGNVPGCVALHVVPQWAVCCAPCCTAVKLLLHDYSALFLWPALKQGSVCPVLQLFLGWSCLNPRMNSERANADKAIELSVYRCKVMCQVEKLD